MDKPNLLPASSRISMEETNEVSIPITDHVWEGDGQVEEMFQKLAILEKLVDDAERRSPKEKAEANIWLKKLIDMMDEVEDWWDEFRIIFQKPKTNRHHHSDEEDEEATWKTKSKVRSFIPSLCSRLKNNFVLFKGGDDIGSKTKALSEKLETFLKDAIRSCFFAGRSWESLPPESNSFSLIEKSLMVLGSHRDSDLERLLPLIIPPLENDGVMVVSIVGMGDSGKTTLAQLVYDDDKVKKYFQLRRWVTIGLEGFDEETIANALLGDGGIRDSGLWSGSLLQIIKDYFSGKKFLLVMDDVWDWRDPIWELFRDTFEHGAPGSIILLTTRRQDVARSMGADAIFEPALLSDEEIWSLLEQASLSGRSHEFSEKVKEIGMKIAEKCKGMPFISKIIGIHLQFKDTVQEWEQVMHSDSWEMFDYIGFSAVHINYKDLPLRLQRCFLCLAAFPIGTDINVEKLIRLWMAQGYLGPTSPIHDDKRMEMKGMEYFKTLAMRFFFHNFVKSSGHKDKIISFHMPYTVHQFAKFQCEKETSGAATTSSLVRRPPQTFAPKEDSLFAEMKHLRALDLSSCNLRQISREVGNLILLQYLNLSGNPLKQLPETICDLHYLQFLDLHFCYMLSHLPRRIGDLVQLRHLRINHTTDELQQMVQGLEKLTSIRTLDVFRVGGRYNSLEKLEKLNDLEELSIVIHGIKGLKDSKLERKNHMRSLEVRFVGEGRDMETVRIINRFEPPPNLEMLKFEGYPGFKLPKWLEVESFISNLKRLTIRSTLNLLSLPAALWKLSSLESLWLYDIPNLKRLGREFLGLPKIQMMDEEKWRTNAAYNQGITAFQSLKTLRIEYLENWRTWEDLNEDDEKHINQISVMPHLKKLIIHGCPELKTLPHRIFRRTSSLKIKVTN